MVLFFTSCQQEDDLVPTPKENANGKVYLDGVLVGEEELKAVKDQRLVFYVDNKSVEDNVMRVFTTLDKAEAYMKSNEPEGVSKFSGKAGRAASNIGVYVYNSINFADNGQGIPVNDPYANDFRTIRGCFACDHIDDKTSSLWNNTGNPVYFYEFPNYQGNVLIVAPNTSIPNLDFRGQVFRGWTDNNGLSNFSWNDKISSVLFTESLQMKSITALHSGKAVEVFDFATSNGAFVVQWGYWGGANQKWKLVPVGNGYHFILSVHSRKHVSVEGESKLENARIVQDEPTNSLSQQWHVSPCDGAYLLMNRKSGLYMEVVNSSLDDGAQLVQKPKTAKKNQLFRIDNVR
jgi:hypothetical protein